MDSNEANALLRIEALSVVRRAQPLLEGIDLELEPGRLLTLVGPNGAGKSTLLRVMAGVLKPTYGRVLRRPGLRVAYVPQSLSVDPNLPLTVARFLRLQVQRPVEPVAAVAEECGVEHLLNRPLQALSGGESRRVLLARALLRNPELLLLDEPAAGLDVAGQTEIYRLIQAVRERRGCGVVVVSHDLHLVMATTDQVICLNEGRMFCRGEPASVVEHPEYRAVFGHHMGPITAVYAHDHPHEHGPECKH